MCGPLIDWNGNGQIDPSDIAVTLAAAEEKENWRMQGLTPSNSP